MSSEAGTSKAAKIFLSYSHKDEKLKDRLLTHLSPLLRQGAIACWDDRQIGAGGTWSEELLKHFDEADIILCLISSDFISSDYCFLIETHRALERQKDGRVRVIPILVKPVDWQKTIFRELQAIPRDNKPITQSPNRDKAFTEVAKEIGKVVDALGKR